MSYSVDDAVREALARVDAVGESRGVHETAIRRRRLERANEIRGARRRWAAVRRLWTDRRELSAWEYAALALAILPAFLAGGVL